MFVILPITSKTGFIRPHQGNTGPYMLRSRKTKAEAAEFKEWVFSIFDEYLVIHIDLEGARSLLYTSVQFFRWVFHTRYLIPIGTGITVL